MVKLERFCFCCSLRTGTLVISSFFMIFGIVNILSIFMDLRLDNEPVTLKTAISICDTFYVVVGGMVVFGVMHEKGFAIKMGVIFLCFTCLVTCMIFVDHLLDTKDYLGMALIPAVLLLYLYFGMVMWTYSAEFPD
jgi:uncharacterized membrane protein